MSRLTEYWETYDQDYDGFVKEGLSLDDFLLKSKWNFHNGNVTFKSKSAYNFTQKGATAAHDLSVKAKVGNNSTVEVKQKASEQTVETNLDFGQRDDLNLGAYGNFVLNQNESQRVARAKFHLRGHYRDNVLLSLGVEDWNPLVGAPNLLSAGTSYGHLTPEVHATINTYWIFNLESRILSQFRFFLAGKRNKFNGRLEATVNRSLQERQTNVPDNKENPLAVNQEVDVRLSFTHECNKNTKYGGDLSYSLQNQNLQANVVVRQNLDRVRLNGKLSTDRSLTVGVTSVYDDLTLTFAARGNLNSVEEKVGDKSQHRYWVGYRFGLSLECNRL